MQSGEAPSQSAASASHELHGRELEALYEQGALRPLAPVDLPEGARLRLHVAAVEVPSAPELRALRSEQILLLALTLGALLLAGLAQQRMLSAQTLVWPAIGMAATAALLLSWAFHKRPIWLLRGGPPPEARLPAVAPVAVPWRMGLLIATALLMLLVLTALGYDQPGGQRPDLNWTFWPWALALSCLLAAIGGWPSPRLARPSVAALLFGLALAALTVGLRIWQIGGLPPTLSGDEGSQGLEAVAVLAGQIRNPFTTGWLGVPTMSFYFNAPTIALLGPTSGALRLPWALVGAATVLVSYLLVARLHGRGLALLSAALLAAYHYHIHYSRLGSNQIADGLFAALTLLCLYRGYDRRSQIDWALCGLVIGVSQFFYAGARFTAVLAGAVVLLLALRDGRRFWREQGWGVATMVAVALLAAAPMIQYALRFPDDYNARVNAVGIVQSGWLEREQAIREQGALPILFDQFQRAALAYNAYPDRTSWYGSPLPLFDLAHGALFLLGIGFAGTRLLDRRIFPLVAWWGGAIIMGGMLTESPPSSQRLITTAIPAIIFVALGLALVAQGLGAALGATRPRALIPALSAATVALMALSIHYYFVDYTPRRIYGNPNAVVATELATYANANIAPNTQLIFLGWPRMSVNFGSFPYLAPHVERVDVMEPLTAPPPPDLVAPDREAIFVFLPEREQELELVRATFPGGTLQSQPSPVDETVLFWVYRVPR
jgi:predicted DNA-binding antitoxin AbrB/MazE fold protein